MAAPPGPEADAAPRAGNAPAPPAATPARDIPDGRATGLPGPHGESLDLTDSEELVDMTIEELLAITIVSATKTEQSMQQAPAVIAVVTQRQIRAWGYRSVAEMLRHVAGFYVIDDHIVPNVGVRGVCGGLRAESGLIKVMVNGHSVAFRSTAGNWLGPELIPLGAVERVEIMRGPASALYGADAFLGVINVITKTGSTIGGLDLTLSTTRVGDRIGGGQEMVIGNQWGNLDLLVAGRFDYEDRSGLALPDTSPAPQVPAYSRDKPKASALSQVSASGLLDLRYQPSTALFAQLTGWMSLLDRGADLADWLQRAHGLDSQGRKRENRTSLLQGHVAGRLRWTPAATLELQLDAMAFSGAPTARDRIEVGSELYYVRREVGFRGFEIEASTHWMPLEQLTVVAGAGLIADQEQRPSVLQIVTAASRGLEAGSVRESTSKRLGTKTLLNPGAHVQAIWDAWAPLASITGGIRYDNHNIFGNQISGRAAVVSSPREDLHIKLLAGNAFKAASPLLLWAVPTRPGDILGNRDLKAQRINTVEGQLLYDIHGGLTVGLGLSYSLLLNKAEFSLQGNNRVAQNTSRLGSLALEGEVRYARGPLEGYLNLTWHRATRNIAKQGYRARLLGGDNTLFPSYIVDVGVLGRMPWLPVQISASLLHVGARRSSDTNSLENGAPYDLPSYALLELTVASRALSLFGAHDLSLELIGRNLLAAGGPDPGFGGIDYPLAPRTLVLQARQRF